MDFLRRIVADPRTERFVTALIVFRHRSNIGRLRDGSERRIGQRLAR